MKKTFFNLFMVIAWLFLLQSSAFPLSLYDGKLDFKGSIQQTLNVKTHQDERNIRYNSFRTTVRGEALYKIVNCPELDIQFYSLANYYYDYVLDIDSNMRYSVGKEAGRSYYNNVQRPSDSEEYLKEAYFDVKYKTFQLRLGKQLVSWGETAEARVADVINPLNLKYIIAFPDWEDYKMGLWMARMFWRPENWWQDMSFEFLVIPSTFIGTRVPPAGHGAYVGQSPMPLPILPSNWFQRVLDAQRRDAPSSSWNNCEVGLRIRGYSTIGEGVDWYLSHFYTRLDSPLINGASGQTNLLLLMLLGDTSRKVWTYPRYNSTAFSFSTTSSKIRSAIRGECAFNTSRDYNYGTAANSVSAIKQRRLLTTALTFDRKTMVPWISDMNRNEPFSLSFTWYQYYMFDHEHNKATGEYIIGETGKDSSQTKFSFTASTTFLFSTLTTVFNIAYDTNGSRTLMPQLVYMPTFHWQFVLFYQDLNKHLDKYGSQVGLSVKYEF